MKNNIVIVFPKVEVEILGGPDSVTLTRPQAKAMSQIHLGGIEALRTEKYKATTAVVNSLIEKKLIDKGGVTDLGKRVGKSAFEALNGNVS